MKKNIYLLLAILTATPSIATQSLTKSAIIASTLIVGNEYNKKLSLDLHYALENADYTSAQKLINTPQVDINAKVDYFINFKMLLVLKNWTPLIACCLQGDQSFKTAKALLNREDIKVNLPDNDGNTPLIICCMEGDKSFNIAKALLDCKDININLQPNKEYNWRPLDMIIYQIKNETNYTYVKLWNILVEKGAILDACKKDYNNLNPNNFKEPQKGYVQSIKNNPPNLIKAANNLLQESNRLRKELEELKKQNSYNNAHQISNALVLIAGASTYKDNTLNLPGVLKDIEQYQNLFGNFYKYKVLCTYDKNKSNTKSLTFNRLNEFINAGHKQLKNNKDQYDALIFIWVGHGGNGTCITSDNQAKKIADIQTKFSGKEADFFADKPKIIIKAASRGVSFSIPVTMRREENKPTKYSNKKAEFTYIFATTEGNAIFDSGYERGSYFTNNLCTILKDTLWRNKKIGEITTELSNRVKQSSNSCECLEFRSTKTKPIFFSKNNTNSEFMDNEEETKEDE